MGPSSMSASACMMPPFLMGPLNLSITLIITLLTLGSSKEWLLSLKSKATRMHRTSKQSAPASSVRRTRMVHQQHAVATISPSMSQILSMSPHFLKETLCMELGVQILFLPKFHPELNSIEQCWGYAKHHYQQFPPSSLLEDLIANTHAALAIVPLESIWK